MSLAAYRINRDAEDLICVVVGLGLVGEAISAKLSQFLPTVANDSSKQVDWTLSNDLVQKIKSIAPTNKLSTKYRLELIWCAGKGGFGADAAQMKREYQFYSKVIESLVELYADNLTVNFLSSAGGLYENSGYVESLDDISPHRPYATYKLKHEQRLVQMGVRHRAYRVSSVYGFGGGRIGLITALLKAANNRQPITIYAQQNTLRDYIYNADLAANIVTDIVSNSNFGIQLQASGRASSINSLLNLVKNVTNKNVMVSYLSDGSNERDIVFSNKLLVPDNAVTSLEEGVRVLNKRMLCL